MVFVYVGHTRNCVIEGNNNVKATWVSIVPDVCVMSGKISSRKAEAVEEQGTTKRRDK